MTGTYSLVLLAALAGGDVTLVEFTDPVCQPCRAMAPVVRRLAAEGFAVRQVDVKRQPDVARQYGVVAYPTYVLFVDGREAQRFAGMTTYDALVQMIRRGQRPPVLDGASSQGQRLPRPLVRGQSPETVSTSAAGPVSASDEASPEQVALAATVRLKVDEGDDSIGVGTGTIIDTHFDEQSQQYEALVLTCGHLFKRRPESGRIEVELFAPGARSPVEGELLDYDAHTDVALVSIWPGVKVTPAPVAPAGYVARPQDQVFTVGCSQGQAPTVEVSKIHAVNRYSGRPNYTVGGQPADGRSGGGLFNSRGELIGVCNAADPHDKEGVYAGLAAIHRQLDEFNLQAIYQRPRDQAGEPELAAAAAPGEPSRQPGALVSHVEGPAEEASPVLAQTAAPLEPDAAAPPVTEPAAADGSTELVCILRTRGDANGQSQVLVIDAASAKLVQQIIEEARATGQARLAARKEAAADPRRLVRRAQPPAASAAGEHSED